jgi:hypothetical protein
MKLTRVLSTLAATAILVAGSGRAHAYPTALNLIPTADIMGPSSFRLGYESDGHNQPFGSSRYQYAYTQVGLTPRLEAGADLYGFGSSNETALNVKYLLSPESKKSPAVALGVMSVGNGLSPSYYAVGFRSFNKFRFHAGAQTQSDAGWMLLGADYALTPQVSILADAQTGDSRCKTLGVYWQASPKTAIGVYACQFNSSSSSSSDYIGGYALYTFPLK